MFPRRSKYGQLWEMYLRCDEVFLFSTAEKLLPRTSLGFLAWRAFLVVVFFLRKTLFLILSIDNDLMGFYPLVLKPDARITPP